MTQDTTTEAFFEAKYQLDPDPWDFENDAYERSRYSAVIQALADQRFARAFEPGCSVGVLTEQLAHIATRVEAIDISATAVSKARERCRQLPNVSVRHAALPQGIPSGMFDLVVMSEIGYYFYRETLALIAEEIVFKISPGGVFVAAHWLGHSADHRLSGDEVHQVLEQTAGLKQEMAKRYDDFRLQKWTRL